MLRPLRTIGALVVGIALPAFLPVASRAGDGAVQNQVSVYTDANAVGYLQPLTNAFGAALNSSFGHSAFIAKAGFHISLEAPVMGVIFEDDDRVFDATTESGFQPSTSASVPTVVGDSEAVTIVGTGGAQFSFPGGLDLHSFGIVVPQLRVSSAGTEAVLRWISFEAGDADIGDVSLFGIGGRHSLSQYTRGAPIVDLALGGLWQRFRVGENDRGGDFCQTDALSIQLQASKRVPVGFVTFEPYAGLAWERLDVDLAYEDPNGVPVEIAMEAENDVRFTIGGGFNFVLGQLWADYSFAGTNSFSFGLAIGNVGQPQ